MSIEQTGQYSTSAFSRRPVFVLLVLVFIPVAYFTCFNYVRETAHPDFLGFDVAGAVRRSHWPASAIALLLSLVSLLRREQFRPIGWVVLSLSILWLLFALFLGAR
jgi:tellurite resistance protein TehA-like permease